MIENRPGNTRVVFINDRHVDHYPTVTVESNAVALEQNYYDINTSFMVAGRLGDSSFFN